MPRPGGAEPRPHRAEPRPHTAESRPHGAEPDAGGAEPRPHSAMAIVFTSGSSGRAKGVVLSRAAFAASAAASAVRLGWRDDDAWLLALPPAHVGGLSVLTRCLAARRTVVLEPAPGTEGLERGLAEATLASLVPAQLHRLFAERPSWRAPARLRAVLLGGAAAPPPLVEEARRRGMPVRETYGLTECASQVATQEPGDPPGHATLLPGFEARVVDGVIELRGPALMTGYLPTGGEPWTADGWLRTGDRGTIDAAGRLAILGRADDVIVTSGENVDPLEVEAALSHDPEVAAALVFGVPDPRRGESVAALLVPRPGRPLDPARVAERLAARLADFKRPRRYAVVADLPLTPSGKPDRGAARGAAGSGLSEYPRQRAGTDRRQETP